MSNHPGFETPQGVYAPEVAPRKDHEVREIINQVRDVAVEFAGTQQLRARIADILIPVLKGKT